MRRATALAFFIRRMSRFISSHVSAIHFRNVRHSRKLQKSYKTLKPHILGVQGHLRSWCWHY